MKITTHIEEFKKQMEGWYIRSVCAPTANDREAYFILKLGRKNSENKIDKKTLVVHGTELGCWIVEQ
jgi:hypothetical protein